MIVAYAQGGGLGHLTRLRAALHTLGRTGPVTVLSASPFAADPRVTGGARVLAPPPLAGVGDLRRWVSEALGRLRPRELIVDAFPDGVAGELTGMAVPDGTRVTHLARLLRWRAYQPLARGGPRIDRTWLVEPVSAPHLAYLRQVSRSVGTLTLREPPAPAPAPAPVPGPLDRPGNTPGPLGEAWLVVHAGPAEEIRDLVGFARETARLEGDRPRLVLVAPERPPGLGEDVEHLDVYPAWPLFPRAACVVSAAGCNVVRQLAWCRGSCTGEAERGAAPPVSAAPRHLLLPFPRRFDDQFTRARRARDPARRGGRTHPTAGIAGTTHS